MPIRADFFTNDVNVLFLPGFLTSLSKGGVRVMLRGIFGAGRVRLCVPAAFLRLPVPGNGRAPGGRGPYTGLCGGLPKAAASGRFRRRAPGGVVRSSPSDFSPPCSGRGADLLVLPLPSWPCLGGLILQIYNIRIRLSSISAIIFMTIFYFVVGKGMENVNFTIFWRVCGFLVGFNRRPPDARA